MHDLADQIEDLLDREVFGRVTGIQGLLVEIAGPLHLLAVGSRLSVEIAENRAVLVEIVGFRPDRAVCLPYGQLEGMRLGCRAVLVASSAMAKPSDAWMGRVIDALGRPIDGKGMLPQGAGAFDLRASPPPPASRARVGRG